MLGVTLGEAEVCSRGKNNMLFLHFGHSNRLNTVVVHCQLTSCEVCENKVAHYGHLPWLDVGIEGSIRDEALSLPTYIFQMHICIYPMCIYPVCIYLCLRKFKLQLFHYHVDLRKRGHTRLSEVLLVAGRQRTAQNRWPA